MKETDKIETNFDDERFRIAFAHNYHLDPNKDLELMIEIRSIITVKHVYEAKRDTVDSVIEYFNKIRSFVTSERYHRMDEKGKRCFEQHVFEVLKGITIKGIGTKYFITGPIHYLSRPDVNEPLD